MRMTEKWRQKASLAWLVALSVVGGLGLAIALMWNQHPELSPIWILG